MKECKYYNEEVYRQTIRGKELTLRPYNEKTDKEIFFKMFKSDKDFKWFYPYPMEKDFKHVRLEGRCTMFDSFGLFSFIIVRNNDQAIMGCITCDSGYCSSHHVLKIGYYMGEEYRYYGYMQKALSQLIDYGFKGKLIQMDSRCYKNRKYVVQAFKATVDLDNDASDHLLRKLGFVCSGIEFCEYSKDGQRVRDRRHYYLENSKHPPIRNTCYNL